MLNNLRIGNLARKSEDGFDLREMLGFAWRHYHVIVFMTLAGLMLGAIHLSRQTAYYTASAQVLLDPRKENTPNSEQATPGLNLYDIGTIESQIAIINSSSLLRRVVDKLQLVNDPEFGVPRGARQQGRSWLESILSLLPGRGAARPPEEPAAANDRKSEDDTNTSAARLAGAVSVRRSGYSYVLVISVTSREAAKAVRLANAVADAYVVDTLDARLDAAKRASAWLSDRLMNLREQLRQSETAVAEFRSRNGLIGTGSQVTITQQQLGEINSRLVAARADLAEKKTRVDLVRAVREKKGDLTSLPDVMRSSTIGNLRAQLSTVTQREADLGARYGARHPLVVNVRAERADVQRAINAEIKRIADNVENEYRLAQARTDAIEKTLREVSGQGSMDEKTMIRLRELQRSAAANKTLFENFLNKAKIASEQSTFEAREARMITPAREAAQTAPKSNRILFVATLLGLLAGVGTAFLREHLNGGFTRPDQIEAVLGVPLLASIVELKSRQLSADGGKSDAADYVIARPLSQFSESIRTLRTGIQMSDVDHVVKVVLVTSAFPNEGKTTTALSMAASAALAGQRVLIVDADLRHPAASRFLGISDQLGLVDVLAGSADAHEALRYIERLGVYAMPAGTKSPNPSDILGSERMKAWLHSVRETFDYVVLDSPPVGPVVDSKVLSRLADNTVVVVRWGVTDRDAVLRTIRELGPGRRVAGVVLNFVNENKLRQYARYGYGSGYGSKAYGKYYSN